MLLLVGGGGKYVEGYNISHKNKQFKKNKKKRSEAKMIKQLNNNRKIMLF